MDARSLSGEDPLACELLIVGAGAAGIALALELAGRAPRVCLLESGGFQADSPTQQLAAGESAGQLYFPLIASRLRSFGGTTNHWTGWCRRLEPEDLERREWIPHSGWPLAYDELARHYPRAEALCELPAVGLAPDAWPPEELRPRLALDPGRVRSAAFQLSPPTRFGAVYRGALEKAANLSLLLHGTATELLQRAGDGRISGVVARTLAGNAFTLRPRRVVLAAGGIENARLLLASPGRGGRGVGNEGDRVGRYFMEHPHVDTARFLPSDPERDLGLYQTDGLGGRPGFGALVLARELCRREGLAGLSATLEPAHAPASRGYESMRVIARALRQGELPEELGSHLWRVVADMDEVAGAVLRRASGRPLGESLQRLVLRGEQVPNPESRVELSPERDVLGVRRARLVWRLGEQDERTLRRGRELLGAELARAGVGRVGTPEDEERVADYALGGHHHMGTTRMADDPRHGVVDGHCRVHGAPNLYVAGSSVFATAGIANPTLTLVALALRLAEHLRAEPA